MMILAKRVLTLLTLGLALPSAAPAAAEEAARAAYGVEIEIAPDAEQADAYQATVVVTDLATEEVLAAPRLRFLGGPEGRGRMRSGVFGGRSVSVEVEVDEAGETAICRTEIRHGERLVSAHRVRVSFGEPKAAE